MNGGWLPTDTFFVFVVGILGLCLGSFLNVVIYRLPLGLSLMRPRSRCGSCQRPIRPYHNVPLLGWMILRGRCADCGARISPRYVAVEALGGALTLTAAYGFATPLASVAALWLFLSLLAVFFIDLDHRIIPDEISLGGLLLGLGISPWTLGFLNALLAALAGAGGLFLVAWIYERFRGRAGMGMGDVKLAGMLGAFLGLPGLIMTILLASLLGSLLGIALMLLRKGTRTMALPFGSFLAPAAAVILIWGTRVWEWYVGLFPQPGTP